MKKQTGLMTLSLLLATSAVAGGAGAPVARPAAAPVACKTIAQLVTSNPQFSTLAVAVEAAGLGDTLSSGAFTVFAPTNAAFAKVPSDMLATVLNDPEMLRSVLLYHVVPGKIAAKQVMGLKSARTAQGSTIDVMVSGSTVMINDATITQVNVPACNGVIHIIDTVLMPPMATAQAPAPAVEEAPAPAVEEAPAAEPVAEEAPAAEVAVTSAPFDISQIPATPLSGATTTTTDTAATDTTTTDTAVTTDTTTADTTTTDTTVTTTTVETPAATCEEGSNTLYDLIVADDRFSTLRDLLSDAGLTETLMSGEYTIFAPTNDAFAAVDPDTLAVIASTPDLLKQVLMYHVVEGTVTADQLASGEVLKTAEGSDLTPGTSDGKQLIGTATVDLVSANVATSDAQACNGTIFVIDKVLLPPNFTLPAPVVEEAPAAETTTAATTTTTTDTTAAAAATVATTTTATTTTVAAAPAATATTTALLLADARFSTLAGLIQAAGLTDTLNSGTYTIFAPTNEAFAKVSPSMLSTLQADVTKLRQVLLYHVVAASIDGTNLAGASEYTSAQGGRLAVTRTGTPAVTRIGDAALDTGSVLDAGASKIYAIDTVLIPQELR